MAERKRLLVEAAVVSAIVGGTAAAVVTRCAGPSPDARDQQPSLSRSATTLTTAATPREVASVSRPPPRAIPAPADTAEPPPAPRSSLRDLLGSIEWEPPIDVSATVDGGAPHHADSAGIDADAGAAPVAANDGAHGRTDAGAPRAIASSGPTFSGGAGRFSTEAPPWGASAWVTDPNGGAGTFLTTPSPWAASAMSPNPQAGAGPFITEQKSPGGSFVFFPRLFVIPFPRSTEDGEAGEGSEGGEGSDATDSPNGTDVGDNGEASEGSDAFEPFELPSPSE